MKKIGFFVLASLLVWACSPAGLSEETKAAIGRLESDWNSASEQLKALADRFSASKDSAASYCFGLDLSENSLKTLKNKAPKADSLKQKCNALVDWFETAGIEVESLKVQFNDDSGLYNSLKDNASKNLLAEDSAKSVLSNLLTKLENGKMKIRAWNETLNANDEEVKKISSEFKSLFAK
jgi:chromosome segregation ATPase